MSVTGAEILTVVEGTVAVNGVGEAREEEDYDGGDDGEGAHCCGCTLSFELVLVIYGCSGREVDFVYMCVEKVVVVVDQEEVADYARQPR